ncbi:hypothetical protein T484DRAFT_1893717 [Baffinella frigidus]|nr:hypothetical protein T484DRAFT_1893717 [Cryptophyta sp. CCMP2293]
MATAIDFQALFAEERARMMAEMEGGSSAASSGTAQQPAPGSGSPRTALHSWESLPDPAVPLSSKPRLDLVEREVCSDALGGVHYVPDFVTPEEAAALLARLEEMPEGCWAQLRRRRLQNHGGTPHSDGMMLEPMPRFVQAVSSPHAQLDQCTYVQVMDATVQAGVFTVMAATVEAGVFSEDAPPNHVLLNEYACGQGIAPHQDGPLYEPQDGPLYEPQVAILSLSGPALLQFWPSLQATKEADGAAASVAAHTGNAAGMGLAIGSRVPRADTRVSLTIRRVLKVADAGRERIATSEAREERRRKEQWWLSSRGEEGLAPR